MKIIERIEKEWEPYARSMPYSILLCKVYPPSVWHPGAGKLPELDRRSISAFNNALIRAGFSVSGGAWPKFPTADVHVIVPRVAKSVEPTDEQLIAAIEETKARLAAIASGAEQLYRGEKSRLVDRQLQAVNVMEARERARLSRLPASKLRAMKKAQKKEDERNAKLAADAKAEADAAELIEAMKTGKRREARRSILAAANKRVIEFKHRTVIRDGEVTRDGRYRAG